LKGIEVDATIKLKLGVKVSLEKRVVPEFAPDFKLFDLHKFETRSIMERFTYSYLVSAFRKDKRAILDIIGVNIVQFCIV
jgi:hypothetical protein